MSEQIDIRSARGTLVRVYINKPVHVGSQTVIILVPGLLETATTPLLAQAAILISGEGELATVRIDSASFYENNSLEKTSIYAQVQDIKDVINYFRPVSKRIVLVAHSMGAFVALLSRDASPDSIIMWDPSLHPRQIFERAIFDRVKNNYHDVRLGRNVSSILMKEISRLPDIETAVGEVTCPIGIIFAESGASRNASLYTQHIVHSLGHLIIPEADHNFSAPQHLKKLVRETVALIKKDRP